MRRVARKVRGKRVLRLIGKYLRAGVIVHGRLQETRLGVPQGRRLSRTLATQTGMTNKWLKDQGLLSVKEL